jgi:hypothetical protein
MSDLTGDLLAAVMAASLERKGAALKVLRGDPLQPVTKPVTGPLLMGIGAGAKYLGVSRITLWRVCQAGRIQRVEIFPGSYRVRREDLEALAAGKFSTNTQPPKRGRPRQAAVPSTGSGQEV